MSCIKDRYKTFYEADKKIWHGRLAKEMYGPEASIGAVALQCLLQDPDHINQICFPNGKKYTNLEIAQWSVSVAEHLRSMNIEQCDIIGMCVSNTAYAAPLFFGAMLAGLTINPLDPRFTKDGIKVIYSLTKPKLMFCDGYIYDTVKEAMQEINLNIPIYTMDHHKDGVLAFNEFLSRNVDPITYRPKPLKFGYNQIACILCSSGTTGKPKGICVSHSALLTGSTTELTSADTFYTFSTLSWISGVAAVLEGATKRATRIISERGFSPEDYLEIIQKYKPTFVFTTPSMISITLAWPKFKDYDLSSVTCYTTGGSALPLSVIESFMPHIPNAKVIISYGLTETSCSVARGESTLDGSILYLNTNMTVKIINDDGQLLGPCEVGEICIKLLYPWAGYYGNEQATKEIYKDGWIHSGDIGYFNEEGRLFIIDRKKDMLKYLTFNFSPTEIEEIINQLPGVAEVCVCGIPDIVLICLPAAAIVRSTDSSLTEQEVYDYVAKNMPHFKHLHGGVYFVDNLPKTFSGKYIRSEVQTILEKKFRRI